MSEIIRLETAVTDFVIFSKDTINSMKDTTNSMKDTMSSMKDTMNSMKDTNNTIKIYTKQLQNFIAIEGKIIEEELNGAMRKYLQHDSIFNKYYIYRLKQWKYINEPLIKNNIFSNKDEITELDGCYVVSSNKYDIPTDFIELLREPIDNIQSKQNTEKPYFIILEAKHSINKEKIEHKIDKMKSFQEYIINSQNTTFISKCTNEYKEKIQIYKLNELDYKIHLFIGAKKMHKDGVKYINNNFEIWKTQNNIIVSYFLPEGGNFALYDYYKNFTPNRLLYSDIKSTNISVKSVKIGSGNNKKRKPKVK
jgi:hypothetical protein